MSIRSLVQSGTKVWLDSIDPDLVVSNKKLGATGATSNPIIIADLLNTGRFDSQMGALFKQGLDDTAVAWAMTEQLVSTAQQQFADVYERSKANDGYVSFELDPLLEDPDANIPHAQRVKQYVELGTKYAAGQKNRMIKVPATPAGLESLEALAAAGVTLNVTLIFSRRQYEAARDAVWRGAQKRKTFEPFKSVYSIFVSRVDVYTAKHVPSLSKEAQGLVGIVNAKQLWKLNQAFWSGKNLPLQQEIIFASTGVKTKGDPEDKYVEALAGSDIQTNPPATNDAVERLNKKYTPKVAQMPPDAVLKEIDEKVDPVEMERVLMEEGVAKFADPFKKLLATIGEKRRSLST